VRNLIAKNREPSTLLAYSVASMLRFLTPTSSLSKNGVFTGKLPVLAHPLTKDRSFSYGSNLEVNLALGEYQFRNDCDPNVPSELFKIAQDFSDSSSCANQIITLLADILKFEDAKNGLVNLWLHRVSFWYFYILKEERKPNPSTHLEILNQAIKEGYWIKEKHLEETIKYYVNTTPAIDLHTHLFPSSHENLFLYGIDELLTYHYLVAEYFQTASVDMTPESK
jgi:hypothetical protein